MARPFMSRVMPSPPSGAPTTRITIPAMRASSRLPAGPAAAMMACGSPSNPGRCNPPGQSGGWLDAGGRRFSHTIDPRTGEVLAANQLLQAQLLEREATELALRSAESMLHLVMVGEFSGSAEPGLKSRPPCVVGPPRSRHAGSEVGASPQAAATGSAVCTARDWPWVSGESE